jgi:hypothetical protein
LDYWGHYATLLKTRAIWENFLGKTSSRRQFEMNEKLLLCYDVIEQKPKVGIYRTKVFSFYGVKMGYFVDES